MLKNRLMPLSGIVFVALILASFFMTSTPGSDASAGTVLTYYRTHSDVVSASALVIGLGVVFGLFFFGYLRDYLRQDRATRWLASTAFGGILLFAAGGALSAGAFAALGDKPQDLSAASAQTLNLIQSDGTNGLLQVGLAVFYLAVALAILRGRLLPAWLGWVSVVLGLLAASLVLAFIAFLATGPWVIIVAIMLWGKADREHTGQEGTPRRQEYAGQP
jgi:hypothetical protein